MTMHGLHAPLGTTARQRPLKQGSKRPKTNWSGYFLASLLEPTSPLPILTGWIGLELTTEFNIWQWVWSTRSVTPPRYPCTCLNTSLMLMKFTPITPEEVQQTMSNPDLAPTRDKIHSAPMPPKCGTPYQLSLRHANPLTPSKQR